jgi:predicted small metal-binding protein
VKKVEKPAVQTETKKDVKKESSKVPKKPATMKFVSCSQAGCGFWAKSHSGKELRYIMKRHAKRYHKTVLTDQQVKEMVKKEGAK